LPYAVVDSDTLHDLKEAPDLSGGCPLPVQTSANTGSQNIATEAQVLTRYVHFLRQSAGLSLHHCPDLSGHPIPAACIAVRLCCRVAVKLHQTINFQTLHQSSASLYPRKAGK